MASPEADTFAPAQDDVAADASYSLGTVDSPIAISDSVSIFARNDRYAFAVQETSEFTIRLGELDNNVDLFLYDASGRELARSTASGTTSEQLIATLTSGSYSVEVQQKSGFSSDYVLTLSPRILTPPDDAGNSFSAARNIGALTMQKTYQDWVGVADASDYYRFEVNEQSDVTVLLSSLSANADVRLYNAQGRQVAVSDQAGPSNEALNVRLASGIYYVLVTPASGANTTYTLTFDATIVPPPAQPLADVPYYGGANDWNVNIVNAPESWQAGYTGRGVIVAVIDTGVDFSHPDLAGQQWVNMGEIAGNGVDDDGNGYIDDVSGWDFYYGDNTPIDANGHGTHVAGTIAAHRNGYGSTGIAYDARIMAIQALNDSGSGSSRKVADGIRYAVDNGAHIINLSIGGVMNSSIEAALRYAFEHNVLVIASAGNDSASEPGYPGAYSAMFANVLAVGAHDINNNLASFSNRMGTGGAVQVDAPGVRIYSTHLNGGYAVKNGTSMAAPHVAGLAALALSANRGLSAADLRGLIVETARRTIHGSDALGGVDGAGLVGFALAARSSSTVSTNSSPSGSSTGDGSSLSQQASEPDAESPSLVSRVLFGSLSESQSAEALADGSNSGDDDRRGEGIAVGSAIWLGRPMPWESVVERAFAESDGWEHLGGSLTALTI
jgi:subtilisin family serine protease